MYKLLSFFIILVVLTSCKPSTHFEKTIDFERDNWVKFKNLEYSIPVEAGKTYSFNGAITTDSNYTHRKLELGFYLYLPSDEQRLEDKTIRIRDLEYQPLGDKVSDGYILQESFKKKLKINESGILKLQIVLHSSQLNNFGIKRIKLSVIEE